MNILTLTCWFHSVKYHLFSTDSRAVLAEGMVERVAIGGSYICQRAPGREHFCQEAEADDHFSAVELIIATLADPRHGIIADEGEISAVGHRVTHGGEKFRHSVKINEQVLVEIRKLHHLAPQHCASNTAGIEAAMWHLPDIPHVAIFDTAFHLTMPEFAYIYPLPYEWYPKYGVRRYGFHGPSHLYLSRRAAVLLDKPADACNLITIHLDRGVSVCAIKNGLSIDTSMGMTPLEGVAMETRCGDIDPGIHAYMMREMDLSAREMEQILNNKSGTSGITGLRPGRQLFLDAVLDGEPRCKLALEIETYRVKKYIGAYLAIIGPLDGVVFTEGTGVSEEPVRKMVLDGLECLGIKIDRNRNRSIRTGPEEVEISAEDSAIKVFVIPTNEELVYIEDVAAIHSGNYSDHQNHKYSFAQRDFVPYGSVA